MKKARTKPSQLFTGLCSVLLDSMIVAFCRNFNNDSIREVETSPVTTGSIGGLNPSKLKYETL